MAFDKTRLATIALAALAVGGAATYFFAPSSGPKVASFAAAQAQSASDVDTSQIREMALGSEDAPVTVIEYASFTCPHCASFHQGVFQKLKKDYIDTGKVRFVYREVYFDRFGLWAGMVARCGGGDRYFGISDLIYEQQRSWTQGEPAQIAQNLQRIGLTAGLDADSLSACMQDADKAQALYALYQKNAEEDNVRSTPSFVIDGITYNNMSFEEFSELIDAEIGG